MPTPFPGMDPYLEQSRTWKQVHNNLINEIQWFLTPILRPYYSVDIEQRTYLAVSPPQHTGIPDVLILDNYYPHGNVMVAAPRIAFTPIMTELPLATDEEIVEQYLEITQINSKEVITVIEVLSPTNKLDGIGREQYIHKRNQVLSSLTNLIEIDLLRDGRPMPMRVRPKDQKDYRLVVSRRTQRPKAEVYLFDIKEPIPDIPIPLRPNETEPILPLNHLLHELYDKGGYDLKIDYSQALKPPLSDADKAWVMTLLN